MSDYEKLTDRRLIDAVFMRLKLSILPRFLDDNAARLVRDRIAEFGMPTIRAYQGALAMLVWPNEKLRQGFSGADHFAFGMQQATPRQQCIAALQALESEQAGREQS